MIVTILGCGGSSGVPMIGNQWGLCNPANPKNIRTRSSILIQQDDITLLVDTSPDLRAQFLRENISSLTAVLFTHEHADHTHGIDDLRSICWLMKAPLPAYGDVPTMRQLAKRFDYVFRQVNPADLYYKPSLIPHTITGPLNFTGKNSALTVLPFEQDHVFMKTLGFRIGDFAYSTDVKNMPEESFAALRGVKTWVVDCSRREEHPTHSHLPQTLDWIARVQPKTAYLVHMGTSLDYDTLCAELPPHIRPAYDGLKIDMNP